MSKYQGMTVNERLYISGLINKFNEAVSLRNIDLVISILKEVDLTEDSIEPILKPLKDI